MTLDCHLSENLSSCFVMYNYVEEKDLLKAGLTLISGILVFSITFGEKVVGLHQGARWARRLLTIAWVGMILALILAGSALALIAAAAGEALYGNVWFFHSPYTSVAGVSWMCAFASGLVFIGSLCALAGAGTLSMHGAAPPQAVDGQAGGRVS